MGRQPKPTYPNFIRSYYGLVKLLADAPKQPMLLSELGNAFNQTYDKRTSFWKCLGPECGIRMRDFVKFFPDTFVLDLEQRMISLDKPDLPRKDLKYVFQKIIDQVADPAEIAAGKTPATFAKLPELQMPPDYETWYEITAQGCNRRCEEIIETANSAFLGIDCQWAPSELVGVVQVANDKGCLIAHVHKLEMFPPALAKILQSSTIVKAGEEISQDIIQLNGSFAELQLTGAGWVDLYDIARSRNYERFHIRGSGPYGLDELLAFYLRRKLPIPSEVKAGNWLETLSPVQQQYAALNTWAAFTLAEHISSIKMEAPPAECSE